ncbi:unnamed protein product [Nesidiocoris tenuis]|uniref:Uncharacterized protein n=1 Tax=Nesidiocoris tenuis TaxID=355587 RepID=A0A6H5GZR7_9HEMI|nr:unnamed protein product [Nesidiocoris tenuis]
MKQNIGLKSTQQLNESSNSPLTVPQNYPLQAFLIDAYRFLLGWWPLSRANRSFAPLKRPGPSDPTGDPYGRKCSGPRCMSEARHGFYDGELIAPASSKMLETESRIPVTCNYHIFKICGAPTVLIIHSIFVRLGALSSAVVVRIAFEALACNSQLITIRYLGRRRHMQGEQDHEPQNILALCRIVSTV